MTILGGDSQFLDDISETRSVIEVQDGVILLFFRALHDGIVRFRMKPGPAEIKNLSRRIEV